MEGKELIALLAKALDGLTDEQKEKAKACKKPSELLSLLSEKGVPLPDEALDMVVGGASIEYNGKTHQLRIRQYDEEIQHHPLER